MAAGDVADCNTPYDEATAQLIEKEPSATVALLGDGVYPTGDVNTYNQCYGPFWGQFKDRTRPTPGNHDYAAGTKRQTAPGYFDYFGAAAGDPSQGFYSYDLGAWHIVSLNANCQVPGAGCTPGSAQLQWLQPDMAAHPTQCLAAYWHQSRFFSMESHGTEAGPSSDTSMSPIWDILEAHGADVVVSAHIHLYERFPRLGRKPRPEGHAGVHRRHRRRPPRHLRSRPHRSPQRVPARRDVRGAETDPARRRLRLGLRRHRRLDHRHWERYLQPLGCHAAHHVIGRSDVHDHGPQGQPRPAPQATLGVLDAVRRRDGLRLR